MIETIDASVTLDYLCELNRFIARNEALEWGKLRTGAVSISGTDYTPPIPNKERVEVDLIQIRSGGTATEQALNAFAWGARGQFFGDGNKRTSMTLANKILISSGAGILTVTDNHMLEFNTLLCAYYESGDNTDLKMFLYHNAIQGITK
ncbi:MAG: Fic family protein [Bacteroides sp.]|nr:Fic family protein [Eubacterium sp.]MCM1419181.1 Fic family protein [Roseburia sp.]MCM1463078.1 Fic family protein [Bacteroides sp.]